MIANPIASAPIEKERIPHLYFPVQEVLTSLEEIKQRLENAERGSFLGNGFTSKVLIYFKDVESLKHVETTIWEVTDTHVILKNNISIPLHRIINIEVKSEDLKYPHI